MEAGAVVAMGLALVETGQRWGQNSMGHFYRKGVGTPVQQRAAVIEAKLASEADRASGGKGSTWEEIAVRVGGPSARTCRSIWARYQESGDVAAAPPQPNAAVKLGQNECEFLVHLYHRFPHYQLCNYRFRLRSDLDTV